MLTLTLVQRVKLGNSLDRLADELNDGILVITSYLFFKLVEERILEDPTTGGNAHDGAQVPEETKRCGRNSLLICFTCCEHRDHQGREGKSLTETSERNADHGDKVGCAWGHCHCCQTSKEHKDVTD